MNYEAMTVISLQSVAGATKKPKDGETVQIMTVCGVVTGVKSKMTAIGSATKYVGSFLAKSAGPVGKEKQICFAKSDALILPPAAEALLDGVDFSAPVEIALDIAMTNTKGVPSYTVKALGPVAAADLAGNVAKRFAPDLLGPAAATQSAPAQPAKKK